MFRVDSMVVSNNYGLGEDDPFEQQSQLTGGTGATRSRVHTHNSIELKYYDKLKQFLDKMAFTLTGDLGCEYGGGAPNGPYPANGVSPAMGSSDTCRCRFYRTLPETSIVRKGVKHVDAKKSRIGHRGSCRNAGQPPECSSREGNAW
jgi:hypothetical protein